MTSPTTNSAGELLALARKMDEYASSRSAAGFVPRYTLEGDDINVVAAALRRTASPGCVSREAVARIIEPEAFAFLAKHASYVMPHTVSGHRERTEAYAKADAILALTPSGEPVAWRWRTLERFSEDAEDREWSLIATAPDFMNPNHHEVEPLYALSTLPVDAKSDVQRSFSESEHCGPRESITECDTVSEAATRIANRLNRDFHTVSPEAMSDLHGILQEELLALGAPHSAPDPNPRPREGWQPISTAPKDGTRILAIRAEWWMPVNGYNRWVFSRVKETFWLAGSECFDFGCEKQPTHWMPLPASPTGDALSADFVGSLSTQREG